MSQRFGHTGRYDDQIKKHRYSGALFVASYWTSAKLPQARLLPVSFSYLVQSISSDSA